jgi:DNA-binding transcriptional LysR family regulator
LRDLPCFSFSAQARRSGAIWQFRRRAERVDVPVKAPVVANSSDMVRELVLRGMGLGLLPGFAVKEDLACGRLQPLLGEWEPTGAFGTAAWVLWQPQRVLPPKLRVFVDYLVEQLSTADDAVWPRTDDVQTLSWLASEERLTADAAMRGQHV